MKNIIQYIAMLGFFLSLGSSCYKGKEPKLITSLKSEILTGDYSFYLDSMYYFKNDTEHYFIPNAEPLKSYLLSRTNGELFFCKSVGGVCSYPNYPKGELKFIGNGNHFTCDSLMDDYSTHLEGEFINSKLFTVVLSQTVMIWQSNNLVQVNLMHRYHVKFIHS